MTVSDARTQDTLARRRNLLGTPYRLFYSNPVELVRGEGTWVFDADGRRYLDAYNNVPCVGHAHPHVVEALSRQAGLLNTHTRYLSTLILDYAERLLATLPADLGRVMLTCTGSEANDLATRIARHWTGNAGFIVTRNAYHGATTATALLSPSLDTMAADSEVVELIDAPERLSSSPEDASGFGQRVTAAAAALGARGIRPAALIVDSILSGDGVVPNPVGFLRGAADAIHAAGGLFIADEVQAGFGRTGAMWGFERHGVVPDIVTMGKPMGNGYPLAGLAARPELVDSFGERTRYFNTFGGSPVACVVGMAVLDVLEDEAMIARAADLGPRLLERLRPLIEHEPVRDVRGAGLYIGLEIAPSSAPDAPSAAAIVDRMREAGVLAGVTGPGAAVVKIRPPLAFTASDADYLVDVLNRVLVSELA